MRLNSTAGKLSALLIIFTLLAAACAADAVSESASGAQDTAIEIVNDADEEEVVEVVEARTGPVTVCELAYYTGDFGDLGPSLTADVRFPVEEVINTDPPLGREWSLVSEDLGTVGEADAARACVETHDAEVVVSIAHGYSEYRNYMLEVWQENDSPIVPSVHGGAIPGNIGGNGREPIFRAQGLDAGLGTSGIVYAETIGARDAVIFNTSLEGFILAADAAEGAAEAVDINVVARIQAEASQSSYSDAVQQLADLEPDVVIVQAGSVDSGNLVKEAAEAGLSLNWIGETGWTQPEFLNTLGVENVATQQSVGFAAFAHNEESEAWGFFSEGWNGTEGYGDEFGDASDLYHFSTYDVMVQTALAVEVAGSYAASAWAPAMNQVGSAPGELCYTYASCLELVRAGVDINYDGVTGNGVYTNGGVNNLSAAYTPITDEGESGEPVLLDPSLSLQIVQAVAPLAECNAQNICTW